MLYVTRNLKFNQNYVAIFMSFLITSMARRQQWYQIWEVISSFIHVVAISSSGSLAVIIRENA
jgi:hypothetical protein